MNAEQREFWQATSNHLGNYAARLRAYNAAFPDGPSPAESQSGTLEPTGPSQAQPGATTRESDLHNAIVRTLNNHGIINWTMLRGTARGGSVYCTPGIPDIYLPGLGWLELKTETGSASVQQLRRHEELRDAGDNIAIITNINQALEVITKWEQKKLERRTQP